MLKELSEKLSENGFNHCLVCWSPRDEGGFSVHHICGYPEEPSKKDIESLVNELRLDEEFNMTDMIFDEDYKMSLLTTKDLATIECFVVKGLNEEDNVG